MALITLAHEEFSPGQDLAKRVATILGFRCISREVLIETSQRYRVPAAKLTDLLDTAPRWWESWLEHMRLYRIVLQAAMCEVARGGNMVYHGYIGHEFFPGIRHVLKVRLAAPTSFRIEQARATKSLSEADAIHYIGRVDKARLKRHEALFGTDWRDPTLYDIVLNITKMRLDTAAHLLVEAASQEDYQPTPKSGQIFQNLALAATVHAAVVVAPKTRNLSIKVRAEKGKVFLSGVLTQYDLEQTIIQSARAIPGVSEVVAEFVLSGSNLAFPEDPDLLPPTSWTRKE